jgi:cysteinyl-tRNA synthetase
MKLKLYNTKSKAVETIQPINENEIKMYNCGPTVYWRAHIGNIRAYTAWDILTRYLLYTGVKINRVVNFTDVGHMSNDDDHGNDKVESTAKEEGKTPTEIANYYIGTILTDFHKMNILHPSGVEIDPIIDIAKMSKDDWKKLGWARATDYIEEMIDIVKLIEKNGYTYETDQAVYFDVEKYADYSALSGQRLSEKMEGVREGVNLDAQKKNPADFVLWMKAVGHYESHIMKWESPWGIGFPGWHIECTAMGKSILGEEFDIHTGGIDHIPVHHSNERAQNWGAFEKEVVRYWVHNEMLTAKDGDKLSKSKKNAYNFDEIQELGYDTMDLRYYFLTVNYRMQMPFSLEGLDGARSSRESLVKKIVSFVKQNDLIGKTDINDVKLVLILFREKFIDVISDNLNTSGALAILSELLKSKEDPRSVLSTIFDFDKVLGLRLFDAVTKELSKENIESDIPESVSQLLVERNQAKADKNYALADELRSQIKVAGFEIIDQVGGSILRKVS